MKSIKMMLSVLVALVSLVAACAVDDLAQDNSIEQDQTLAAPGDEPVEQHCSVPGQTVLMRLAFEDIEQEWTQCRHYLNTSFLECRLDGTKTQEVCAQERTQGFQSCDNTMFQSVTDYTMRECFAPIFTRSESGHYNVNVTGDTDGDGIADYYEYRMGLNPCLTRSRGDCRLPDADDDFDNDGVANGIDENPICRAGEHCGF